MGRSTNSTLSIPHGVPDFDGTTLQASTWLKVYLKVTALQRWTDGQRLDVLYGVFRKEPLEWLAQGEFADWDVFVTAFNNRYVPADDDVTAFEELQRLKMGSTTYHQFALNFKAQLVKAKVVDDPKAIAILLRAVPGRIRDALERSHPKTIAEALTVVQTEDSIYRRHKDDEKSGSSSGPVRHARNRPNGEQRVRREQSNPLNYPKASLPGFKPNKSNKPRDDSCRVCHKMGHYARDCPDRPGAANVPQPASTGQNQR